MPIGTMAPMRTFIVRLWHPTAPEVDSSSLETAVPDLHGRIEDPITGLERSFESGPELIAIIGAWMGATTPVEHGAMGD
jgi:hypothetical protein